jgi:FtsH-binding integral membrane protein
MMLVGYVLSVLVGTMMYQSSDNPAISFLGYNFIVVPVGIVLTPFLYGIDPNIIGKAMILTGGFTGIMMTLGIMYPSFFLSLGRVLFFSLLLMIGVQFTMAFFFHLESGVIDWIIALIFCGYIGYDWARANKIPKTLDNAVDSAASLYLDIINLFIRIIRILGRR